MFTVVDWVLLRPLPYVSPEQLVRVFAAGTTPATAPTTLTLSEYRSLSAAKSLQRSAAFSTATRVLRRNGTDPIHVVVCRGDGDLFGTLGITPYRGRFFLPGEVSRGEPVIVLSYQVWRGTFRGDDAAIGSSVFVDDVAHTIVGVTAPNYQYPAEADIWKPLAARERGGSDRELAMVARLSQSISADQANAELETIARTGSKGTRIAWADGLHRTDVKDIRTAVTTIFVSTLFVLLIVCANVASLLSTRAQDRIGEMALRGALGASRRQLFVQLMVEGMLLAVVGGVFGVAVGQIALRVLVSIAPTGIPRLAEISMDLPVFATTLIVTVVVGLGIGLWPALRLSRANYSGVLQLTGGQRTTARSRARRVLVLGQVALAVILTIGAGLLTRSLRNLLVVDNGFDVDHILAVDLDLRGSGGSAPKTLFADLVAATTPLDGVRAAAVSLQLPTQIAGLRAPVQVVGDAPSQSGAVLRVITPLYFDALGVSTSSGRPFARSDTNTAPFVAIVNAAFVHDVLGDHAPLGTQLTTPLVKAPLTIVGTVPDLSPAGEPDRPALYVSADQVPPGAGYLLVRLRGDPATAKSMVASRVREVAPMLPVDRARPLADVFEPKRAMTRFNTQLISTFATLALLLSVIGVYGMAAGEVAVRWREIAVRIALGASPRGVLWMMIRPSAAIILSGAALGVAGALALTPLLASLLRGVGPTDRLIFALAPLALTAVGVLATAFASMRVLRAAPAETLRTD